MIRSWSDIEALDPPLTAPERRLIEACKAGEMCMLGDGTRPERPDPARTIRADLLRYLILGGCDECRLLEWGVQLAGAWISGELDLSFATAKGPTGLLFCRFQRPVQALHTAFDFLNLIGCALPGLNAQGVSVTGSVFLSGGFEAKGEVSLAGAVIGGQLDCTAGTFCNPKGKAINAYSARVTGAVFMCAKFEAEGEVNLLGAAICGELNCIGGTFRNPKGDALNADGAQVLGTVFLCGAFRVEGEISLSGTVISGQLDCTGGTFRNPKGIALNGQRMTVIAGFFWRGAMVEAGQVVLASARVGDLIDDLDSWPVGENRVILDGFTYDRISASFTDAKTRLAWLARGTLWKGSFTPNPTPN
ncbi:hypothetical protein [Pararhodobacter zhoushanensis]|uniref:Uncharacterized protein n=1 Tax=Pararhodobacter zhoushanensis TaxID=2479545 RepID=A0ABT3H3U3_9RHOB|nr:hypothetical protein [Pararhodobacter zhoushanensis]MCW1934413.1 hypothetical protein [Pararhodobacter zhoushanensis]